ncbi:MAG: ribosome maturation factor RimM [Rhodoferax sp.]|nr:ribosome maturation factor RimM [Rhodoferax sp.]
MSSSLEVSELPADAVEVGRISDAWGVKGWFKVMPYSADSGALFSSKSWFLLPPEKGAKLFSGVVKVKIAEAKTHSGLVVASIKDVGDRSAAEGLRGSRVFVSRSTFPSPGANEYYWVDLIGLDVVNRESVVLGQVKELLSTGAQTVLVIQYQQDRKPCERMIPFVSVYIDDVDLSKKCISVDWQPDF